MAFRIPRSLFFLVPACTTAWAMGCSDEAADQSGPGSPDAAADVSSPNDAGSDTAKPAKRDCTNDLDDDKLAKHLECAGLFESFADKKVAADAKPYKPSVEFWSDGAEKQRWVRLPASEKIDISDWDEWKFPVGTAFFKEFKFGGKRIETRLFTKLPDKSWGHAVYRWNADESDAVRKDQGEKIPGLGPNGAVYEIPTRDQCEQCHFGRRDQVLGFDAVGLGLPTAEGQTLASLAAEGRFSTTPPATSLNLPAGTNGDKSRPALGWLHANCGPCHNTYNNAAASFARIHFLVHGSQLATSDGGALATLEELDTYKEGYCKDAIKQEPDAGAPYKLLRGGAPSRSLVSVLSGRRAPSGEEPTNEAQMPPLVTHAVDQAGHKLVDDWINVLPPCP